MRRSGDGRSWDGLDNMRMTSLTRNLILLASRPSAREVACAPQTLPAATLGQGRPPKPAPPSFPPQFRRRPWSSAPRSCRSATIGATRARPAGRDDRRRGRDARRSTATAISISSSPRGKPLPPGKSKNPPADVLLRNDGHGDSSMSPPRGPVAEGLRPGRHRGRLRMATATTST